MRRKLIIPTGYMGSGSSAITDLLSEFEGNSNVTGSHELVFLHCPHGIFDLEDQLLKSNNIYRSDISLKEFKKEMKALYNSKYWWAGNYKKEVSKNFMTYVEDLISTLIDFEYTGFWYMNEKTNINNLIPKLISLVLMKITNNRKWISMYLKKNKIRLSYIHEEKFYKCCNEFIFKIVEDLCEKDCQNVVIDQLLLPYNLDRMGKYFYKGTAKAIVVERDPRDVFILNKYYWSQNHQQIPIPMDVLEFCRFYQAIREKENIFYSDDILRLSFEDLVYNYENSVNQLCKFLELDIKTHIHKLEKFNPKLSISNTQVFNAQPEWNDEATIIRRKLNKYCYEFPYLLKERKSQVF